jgi:hypothetical protein
VAWRHDQHGCRERLDRIELLTDEARVVLGVLERRGFATGVLRARDERDLDRVAAGRGRVEDAAKLELDADVGRRRVGRQQRVRLEVVGGRIAVCERAGGPGGEGQRGRDGDRGRADGRSASARPGFTVDG